MDKNIKRVIQSYLDKKYKNPQKKRTPSPYIVPLTRDMEQYPYYTDQEVTENHLQLNSPHGENDTKDRKDKLDKQFMYPEQDWTNVDWAGGENFLAPYENTIQKEFDRTKNSPENLYDPLRGASMGDDIFDLNTQTSSAIDNFLKSKDSIKISSIDLGEFIKISEDILIHKSKKDLWKMYKDADGDICISRLFENDILGDD